MRVIEARDRIGGRVYTNRDWGVPLEMGASWTHGTTDNPLTDLARKAQARLVPTDDYGWAKLAVDPRLQPLDYRPEQWRKFVDRARDQVDGGSLGAAVNAAAATAQLSESDRAQLAFYITTEIENEYAASAVNCPPRHLTRAIAPVVTRTWSQAATTPCHGYSPPGCRSC